jgi:ketosteroid isomerase-like protein
MANSARFLLGPVPLLAVGLLASAGQKEEASTMTAREQNLETMRKLFRAVEDHDEQVVTGLYQQDVEFCWPPSLPYGGCHRGLGTTGPTWGETWALLQPDESQRKMHPRVVAASDDEVVVLWRQRGISPAGEPFDGEVLGLYRFRDAKLARAQMFYFDSAAVKDFLARAISPQMLQKQRGLFNQVEKLPQARQLALRQAYWKLQAVPRDEQRQKLNSATFTSAFSHNERDLLQQLLGLNTAKDQ